MARKSFPTLKSFFRCYPKFLMELTDFDPDRKKEMVVVLTGDLREPQMLASWDCVAPLIRKLEEPHVRVVGLMSGQVLSMGVYKALFIARLRNKLGNCTLHYDTATNTHKNACYYTQDAYTTVSVRSEKPFAGGLEAPLAVQVLAPNNSCSNVCRYRLDGESYTLDKVLYKNLPKKYRDLVVAKDTLDTTEILGYPKQLSILFKAI